MEEAQVKEIILALITNSNGGFAFVIMALCAVPAIWMIAVVIQRANNQNHQERMAQMELSHREKMLNTTKAIETKRSSEDC